jgi:hypothetical protein
MEIDYEKSKNNRYYLLCECECGNIKSIRYDHLKSEKILSCGCKRKDNSKNMMENMNTSHNMSKTRFYKCWCSMKERCSLVNNENYKEYLEFISKFHNYSRNNTILIHMQKPDATLCGSFKTWEKQERFINKDFIRL